MKVWSAVIDTLFSSFSFCRDLCTQKLCSCGVEAEAKVVAKRGTWILPLNKYAIYSTCVFMQIRGQVLVFISSLTTTYTYMVRSGPARYLLPIQKCHFHTYKHLDTCMYTCELVSNRACRPIGIFTRLWDPNRFLLAFWGQPYQVGLF